MNVKIGTGAEQFLFWEYLFRILGIHSLQCVQILEVEEKPLASSLNICPEDCCTKSYTYPNIGIGTSQIR